MKKELDEALCRDFPLLYLDRNGDRMSTCMCWGFECEDGWEPLIRRLSAKLEALIAALPEDQRGLYCAAQVKQKFAGLRVYMTCETQEMMEAICEAEAEAWRTCEYCGAPGRYRSGGWVETLCDVCFEKREAW